jgi:hypothetical protein
LLITFDAFRENEGLAGYDEFHAVVAQSYPPRLASQWGYPAALSVPLRRCWGARPDHRHREARKQFRRVNGFLLLAVLDEEIRGTVTHPEYDQQNVIAA